MNIDLLKKSEHLSGQIRLILKDQRTRWVWVRLFPILGKNGELYRVAGIASDITLQKEYEDELKAATKKAMESDQLKSAFLANLSHEIRTPMNGIVGFSGLLLNQEIQRDTRKIYVDVINNCSAQLLHIIDDMVDISKIEANQMSINKDICSINELLDELYTFFSQQLKLEQKTGISLHLFKDRDDSSCNIVTDPFRLRQVLMNLLNNAVKFTHAGTINFGYSINNLRDILFYVKDTGIGIEDDLKEEVFKPFRQADLHASREYGGAGLGLSISKGLVKLLGGSIWYTSEPGKGSEFCFTIPFVEPVSHSAGEKKSLNEPGNENWNVYTALIVEDDEVNYLLLEEVLKIKEFKIIRAFTGVDAVDLARNCHPDIIIMDIRLPVMNGLDATRKIREGGNNVPIIAQTAFAMAEDRELCLQAGCNDYISKPIKRDVLIKKISACLNSKNSL